MLISYNFLADYVDLSGISLTELCDKLYTNEDLDRMMEEQEKEQEGKA